MRVELTEQLTLTYEQEALLDLHSFINVIAVITAQLQALALALGEPQGCTHCLELALRVRQGLTDAQHAAGARALQQRAEDAAKGLRTELAARTAQPSLTTAQRMEVSLIADAILAAADVLEARAREYANRMEAPLRWIRYDAHELQHELVTLLKAIERNAIGRYRIVFDPSEHDSQAYLVLLDIRAVDGDGLLMPAVLHDVMRDLIANARKYTAPGGVLRGELIDTGRAIHITVRDNGRGIPPDELKKVVSFGYRAQNTLDARPNGGGFGLTKAYAMTKRFGGRMWIDSDIGRGTSVSCIIPRPASESGRGCRRTQRAHCT